MMSATVYLIRPYTDEARAWVKENVSYEDYQVLGSAVAVEHRYIDAIVEAMLEEGFVAGEDFEIVS